MQAGGTPAVLRYLIEKGLIDGSILTVTGVYIRPSRCSLLHMAMCLGQHAGLYDGIHCAC